MMSPDTPLGLQTKMLRNRWATILTLLAVVVVSLILMQLFLVSIPFQDSGALVARCQRHRTILMSKEDRLLCALEKKEKEIALLRSRLRLRLRDQKEVQDAIQAEIQSEKIYEKNLWNRWFPYEDPSLWQQHNFKTHGVYGFIQFSGYRLSDKMFVVIGLASVLGREARKLQACHWHSYEDEYQRGNLSINFQSPPANSAPLNLQYEAAALVCSFENATISDLGSYVVVEMDFELFVVYVESSFKNETNLKYNLAYCGAGWHGEMDTLQVRDWMEFHRVLYGVEHFYLYDSGAIFSDQSLRSLLSTYSSKGLVSITDMREVLLFGVKSYGQPMAYADCVYKSRSEARWIFTADVDEYLEVVPPHTLQSLLKKYEDKPWLTRGSFNWKAEYCENQTDQSQFLVERIRWKSKAPHCVKPDTYPVEKCLEYWGHRKLFANPKKVDLPETHVFLTPPGGVDLDAVSEMRNQHMRGLGSTKQQGKFCSKKLEEISTNEREKFEMYDRIAELAKAVRGCPLEGSKNCTLPPVRWE